MKKALLIGLIVAVLALGGIGAAYATGMDFHNVQALSRGESAVPQINCVGVDYNLVGANNSSGVVVNAVRVAFDAPISNAALAVSLRGSNGSEIGWHASNGNVLAANTWSGWIAIVGEDSGSLSNPGTLPGVQDIYSVKVTVANNSVFNWGGPISTSNGTFVP